MPATKASVVIRIGRSRSRFAWRIASSRSHPLVARSWFVWSICRIPFFFTMPKSTRMPSDEKMLIDWFRTTIDRSANGTVSGSASRIVIGWIQLSNCAARIRYMKMIESRNAMRNADAAFPCSRERPVSPDV